MADTTRGFYAVLRDMHARIYALASSLSGFVLLFFAVIFAIASPTAAYAVPAACTTLSSLDTNSYTKVFPASAFNSGETVTVSYTDDGEDPADSAILATDHVLVQDAGFTGAYGYNYYSSSKVSGLHSLVVTSSQLTATGLSLGILTGTHIGTVSIRCTSSGSVPTVADTSTTVAANSSANLVTLSITGTASSVAIASNPVHGTANVSGTTVTYSPAVGYSGSDSLTYTATNATGTSTPATATITVTAPTLVLSPVAGALPAGIVGTAYGQAVTASGGTAPYRFSVTSGSLPSGFSFNTSTGVLSGTPAASGNASFTITATDANGATGSAAYTLAVGAQLSSDATLSNIWIGAGSLSPGFNPQTTEYSVSLPATATNVWMNASTTSSAATFFAGGAERSTGSSWQVNLVPGENTVQIVGRAEDRATTKTYTVTITRQAPVLVLSPAAGGLVTGTVGTAYSQIFSTSGGTAPYSYAVTAGTLPAGLTLSTSGLLSGTPTAGGNFNFTITATDSVTGGGPFSSSQAYSLTVAAPTITLSPSSLASATIGTAYSQTIGASGGTSGYTYAVSAGSLPAGLSLSPTSGILSGTPTAGGNFNFTITATDSSRGTGPFTGSQAYSITVAAPAIQLGPASLPAGLVGAGYSGTVTASGGTGSYSYAVTAGALPDGMTLSTGGGLSGTPTAGGSFNFTITATDSSTGTGPFSGSRAYSLTIAAPSITIAPTTLSAAALNNAYSQSITAMGGTAAYSFAISAGTLPSGLTLSSNGTLSGTPTAQGTFDFTVTATDSSTGSGPFTGSRAYSLAVTANPPLAGSVAATVAANSTNNPITLNISGGTATSVAVATAAMHGTATASGAAISYTPTAGYSGSDSFAYTATNADGTSLPATVSVTVSAPTISVSPPTLSPGAIATSYGQSLNASGGTGPYSYAVTTGALPAGLSLSSSGVLAGTPTASGTFNFIVTATDSSTGSSAPFSAARAYSLIIGAPAIAITPAALPAATAATAYSQTITASGGAAPYTYTVTAGALPAGLTLSSGGVLSGTPTASGTFNITVTATDSSTGTGAPFSSAHAYSLAINVQPPIAGSTAATVAANSSANSIALAITGGAPASVAIANAASHGTASASGTTITYTPMAGYSGTDSFTYIATNASGTSAPATVSLTVTAPVLVFSPASGALAAGMMNTGYSQTVTASGGTGPYSYSESGTLPAGLALNRSTGAITGTPSASGTYHFEISAIDANNATTSAAYTLAISPPPTTFAFTPAGGALSEAMAGEAYSQQVSATGGTGTKIYSLASGSLPNGLVLNISTGQLTGPLSAGSEGDYSFAIQVRDGNGATGAASYTLKVKARSVTAADKVVDVPAGSAPGNVYLNSGATGGPFSAADLTFVEPANAGTATIIQGQLAQAGPVTTPVGWYLQYTPNPAYSGQVRVGYKLTSALGVSNTGTVTYNIRYDAGRVAEDVSNLVHGFVQSRQNMIANTIEVPGLLQRRQMQKSTDPITARMTPSEQGMTLGFSTSLTQMRAAGGDADAASSPFNVWIGGAFLAHDDKSRKDDSGKWGSFAMINMGADYLISDRALVGLSFHYDRMTDPTDGDAELTGNGWLAGPYASIELGRGVFWNGSLRYGGSSNTINTEFWDGNFKTTRWMADTSIEGQWNLDEDTTLSPKLRAIYFSETVDDYTVRNSSRDALTIDGFDEEQFRVSLGAEIARSFTLENGTKLTPKLGLTGGFSGLDGAGAFGAVTAGLTLQTANFWMLDTSLLFNIEGDGQKSVGAKVSAARKF
ncbi:MAG: hemagglutinin [Rhizobium sp.]|nr:MAG: hemagglutinin [Rhizobium sp.]